MMKQLWLKLPLGLRVRISPLIQRILLVSYAFRPSVFVDDPRYVFYQKDHITHHFSAGERVLDIGSGGEPFPFATILADRYLEPTHHRSAKFASNGLPVVICDIHALPFLDNCFDYVVCSHVLEHVADPILASHELQRVGLAGLIDTPTFMKDALFAWAKGMHKWHVVSIHNRLVFFEYNARQLEGIRSNSWNKVINFFYHPLQESFKTNQDIFNVIFEWQGQFEAVAMLLDGTINTL